MKNQDYEVKCLACSDEIGQMRDGRFVPRSGHRVSMPYLGSLPRCGHCGGSLYLEPADGYSLAGDQAELLRMIAAEVAWRPSAA